MSEKLEHILELVSEYIAEKQENEKWTPGEDWVSYSGPVFDDQEYLAAVRQVLDGWMIFGKNAREFETKFPSKLGKLYGALTNSGSSANLLMVAAAKSKRFAKQLKDGDKVITPVVCFPTTVNPIIQNNLVPVFVDVELPSVNLDLDKVEEVLEADPGIRGIMFCSCSREPTRYGQADGTCEEIRSCFL
jgi:CDP-6-deoxy-D-xylo-4-hexulose-3-dehydrase